MNSDFYIKTGDSPEISDELPGDLTKTGASVQFSMKPVASRGAVTIDSQAVSVDDEDYDVSNDRTTVSYQVPSTATTEAGDYLAEFEASYADGEVITFPRGRYYFISISEEI